ncbi:plasmid mobilization relaxosome protein MobC [Yersinia enterocolitica]
MVDPALLRQLAGFGNNLNQIARQVNTATVAGGALPAVQICAGLAALERELRLLREAYSHDC